MPSKGKSKADDFKTMHKSRQNAREGQSSIASRRKSVRMDRKQRRDEEVDKRRAISGLSLLSESLDLDDTLNNGPKETQASSSKAKEAQVLSLKEKLQKWRLEKQRQLEEKKKKQPQNFIVKNVAHSSDLDLYREIPQNNKKLAKPVININFVKTTQEKTASAETAKASKKGTGAKKAAAPVSKTQGRQVSQKLSRVESKPEISTRSGRVTRQTAKTVKPAEEAVNKGKSLTHAAKSMSALPSAMQESKLKPKAVRGDLHSRLTAAAAAKMQENNGKPKEFLRAKPHRVTRSTRAQTKRERPEEGVESSEVVGPSSRSSAKKTSSSKKNDVQLGLSSDSEFSSSAVTESPAKRPRRSAVKKTARKDALPETESEHIGASSTASELEEPAEKISVKATPGKARRSLARAVDVQGEISQGEEEFVDLKIFLSKKGRRSVVGVVSMSDDEMADVDSAPEYVNDRKWRRSAVSTVSSEDVDTESQGEDLTREDGRPNEGHVKSTPERETRRSVAVTAASTSASLKKNKPGRKSTLTPARIVNAGEHEGSGLENEVSATPGKISRHLQLSTVVTVEKEEELAETKSRSKATPAEKLEDSQTPQAETDAFTEKVFLSLRKSRRSIMTSASSASEAEGQVGGIVVTATPGRRTRRSVAVVAREVINSASKEEVQRTQEGQVKRTPGRKSWKSVAADLMVTQDEYVVQQVQVKATPGRKSRKSTAADFTESQDEQVIAKVKATPGRKSRKSVATALMGSQDEQVMEQVKATPGRKSRRSIAADLTDSQDEQAVELIQVKATPGKKSRKSVAADLTDSQDEQMIEQGPVKATPGRKSRKSIVADFTDSQDEQVLKQVQVKATPGRKSRKSVAADLANSEDEQVVEQVQVKATPGRKSRRSIVADFTDSQDEQVLEQVQVKATPGRKSRKSVAADLTNSQDEQVVEQVKVKATSGRKSRRSVLVTTDEEECSTSEGLISSSAKKLRRSVAGNVSAVATPGRKSRRSLRLVASSEGEESEPACGDQVQATPSSRRSRRLVANALVVSEEEQPALVGIETGAFAMREDEQTASESNAETETLPSEEQADTDTTADEADTQALLETEYATPVSDQRSKMAAVVATAGSCVRRSTSAKRKTPKSARRRSQTRARRMSALPAPGSFTPRRSRGRSIIVSVSEEGTSKLKGESVVGEAVTPESSFIENKTPGSSSGARGSKRTSRSSIVAPVTSVSSEDKVLEGGVEDNSAYRLAKPACLEPEIGPLQELTVEKVEGEISYIEVPMDESHASVASSSSPAKMFDDSTSEANVESQAGSANTSSIGTEPFTPRKACDITASSQSSVPDQNSGLNTPDLPPRQPIGAFKTPLQAPLSAARARSSVVRSRARTEPRTSKSPEEMIEILARSPMIEMTRRRSRHVSTPSALRFTDVVLEEQVTTVNETTPSETSGVNINTVVTSAETTGDTEISADTSPAADHSSAEPTSAESSPAVVNASGAENSAETSPATENGSAEADADSVSITEVTPPVFNTEVQEKVKHFRNILVSETDRLNQMCDTWNETSANTAGLSEDVLGQIRTAVGKAQLLIAQRFKQFSGLVDNCEFNLGELKTRPEDLQGFWEVIYFQVEDVNSLFEELKVLQNNNWEEKKKTPPKPVVKRKMAGAKAFKPKGKSNFSAFRQEMMQRKAKKAAAAAAAQAKQEEFPEAAASLVEGGKTVLPSVEGAKTVLTVEGANTVLSVEGEKTMLSVEGEKIVPSPEEGLNTVQQQDVEFDGGFFKVSSPARTAQGRRSTLSSHTNTVTSPPASNDNSEKTDVATESAKPSSPEACAVVDKENQSGASPARAVPAAQPSTPQNPARFGMTLKRLSYVPVVPSPLLNDITGIPVPKKS